jgi:hypothetical protein
VITIHEKWIHSDRSKNYSPFIDLYRPHTFIFRRAIDKFNDDYEEFSLLVSLHAPTLKSLHLVNEIDSGSDAAQYLAQLTNLTHLCLLFPLRYPSYPGTGGLPRLQPSICSLHINGRATNVESLPPSLTSLVLNGGVYKNDRDWFSKLVTRTPLLSMVTVATAQTACSLLALTLFYMTKPINIVSSQCWSSTVE